MMNKINILYVIWSLGLGGAEQVVISLAKGLDRARFNPIVCCLNEKGRFADELEKTGIKIIALHKNGPFDLRIIGKLVRVIKENNIDIVNTHLWGANLWGRIAAHKAKVKVIIATEHNLDNWKNWLHIIFDKWLSHRTDKIIAVSESVKYFYVNKVGIPSAKMRVIYNGVDAGKYIVPPAARGEFNITDNDIVLGVVGRLVPQKGHRYFLLALKEILMDAPKPIKALIVGSGPLDEELKAYVNTLGLNNSVIFTGLRHDVPRLLRIFDVLVMPSLREGLPMVALEAMAAGIPIIATKVGGIPELVDSGKTGLLVEPENYAALKEAIMKLIADQGFADELARNAKIKVESEFSVSRMVDKTQSLFEEIYNSKN